jgi:hypothetical protein
LADKDNWLLHDAVDGGDYVGHERRWREIIEPFLAPPVSTLIEREYMVCVAQPRRRLAPFASPAAQSMKQEHGWTHSTEIKAVKTNATRVHIVLPVYEIPHSL